MATSSTNPRRSTRQREAVRSVLRELDGFHSAQEIHAELGRREVVVGLSTVYRTLSALATDGELDSLLTGDGETVYRRCADVSHHHHLVCRRCGATVEIDGPVVEAWTASIAAEHSFDQVSHTLEVFGRCASCRR